MKLKGHSTSAHQPAAPRPLVRRKVGNATGASATTEIGMVLRHLRSAIGQMQDLDPNVIDLLDGLDQSYARLRSCPADRGIDALLDLYSGVRLIRSMLLAEYDQTIH